MAGLFIPNSSGQVSSRVLAYSVDRMVCLTPCLSLLVGPKPCEAGGSLNSTECLLPTGLFDYLTTNKVLDLPAPFKSSGHVDGSGFQKSRRRTAACSKMVPGRC
jgi:hypothetical protein